VPKSEIEDLRDGTKVTSNWEDATATSPAGRRFTDITGGGSIFLPASGNRNSSTGALELVGDSGRYWSGWTGSTGNGYNLFFSGVGLYMENYRNLGYAFSIRCVAAE
jgi:hypothetical protein